MITYKVTETNETVDKRYQPIELSTTLDFSGRKINIYRPVKRKGQLLVTKNNDDLKKISMF